MKNKQIIGIVLILSAVLSVFCGCRSKEPEVIPNTPEITFATEESEIPESSEEFFEGDEDSQEVIAQTTKKASETKEETATTAKNTQSTKVPSSTNTASSVKPDNSVETKPKTTASTKETTKKNTSTTEKTTTTKSNTTANNTTTGSVTPTNKPVTTVPTTEHTTKKSTETITPITAELTYLNDPKNSFIAKVTDKELEGYGMSEADKASFKSDRTGWAEYTVRVDFTNNDETGSATIYTLEVGGNGTSGVYVNGDPRGDMSIAPGKKVNILFNVLVKDSSMIDTVVLKTVSEMQLKVKYAATPENDTDLPNYKYVTVE